jgi:ABC-2 type transport system permease protein
MSAATNTATNDSVNAAITTPSPVALVVNQIRHELRLFMRDKAAFGFSLLLPLMFLVLFNSIFSGERSSGYQAVQSITAGMMANGIGSAAFMNMAISVVGDRESGTLKRYASTPMPRWLYFAGRVGLAMLIALGSIIVMMVVAVLLFDLQLPTSPAKWFTIVWVFVLSSIACSLCGIAFSTIPRSVAGAPAIVNLPYLAIQFISGVFVPFDQISGTLQKVASIFPIKWMGQGFRSALLPDAAARVEPSGSWQHGWIAAVLVLWCVIGVVASKLTFRWTSQRD